MRFTVGMMISFLVSAATVTLSVPPFFLILVPLMWLHLWVARGVRLPDHRDDWLTAVEVHHCRTGPHTPEVYNVFPGHKFVLRSTSWVNDVSVASPSRDNANQEYFSIRAFSAEYRFCESIYLLLDRYHWTDYCRTYSSCLRDYAPDHVLHSQAAPQIPGSLIGTLKVELG